VSLLVEASRVNINFAALFLISWDRASYSFCLFPPEAEIR